jgi:L,D-transpeptidase ErfK/SrfK
MELRSDHYRPSLRQYQVRLNGEFRMKRIGRLCGALLVAAALSPGTAGADIRPLVGTYSTLKANRGDTLPRIARREDVNAELLATINHLHNGRVRPGQRLTMPTLHILPREPKEGIVLNIPERAIYVFRRGQTKAVYPVAVGKASWPTATGEFTLISKVINPKWRPTKEMVERDDIKDDPVPPGKDNPVGDRWMGWSKKGYGFHSTTAPASVGKAVSHGCVRLYPEAAHKMFDLVREGESIYVVYEPITLGRRENRYYLSVFPDIYHRNLVSNARAKAILQNAGLLSRVNMNEVARIVRKQEGYPTLLHLRAPAKSQVKKPKTKGKPPKGSHPQAGKGKGGAKAVAKPHTAQAAGKAHAPAQLPTRPLPPPSELAAARKQGALLVARVAEKRIGLLHPERDLIQLKQWSERGYIDAGGGRPLAIAGPLRQALARLANHTSPSRPLVLMSLYRPLGPDRLHEPHGNGMAADIAAFGGHTIDNQHPGEALEGVLAILRTLPPGQYRLGLPKPPDSDPAGLLAPPPRPQQRWPFFPAPIAEIAQIGAVSVVMPRLIKGAMRVDPQGRYIPEVTRWQNERAAPLSDLGEPRLRRAIAVATRGGVQITLAFPDAADHLHVDVMPPGPAPTVKSD